MKKMQCGTKSSEKFPKNAIFCQCTISHSIWSCTSVRSILSVLWAPMGVPFPFYLGFDENMPNFAMSCQKKSRLHPLQMISHSICVSRVWGGPFYLCSIYSRRFAQIFAKNRAFIPFK